MEKEKKVVEKKEVKKNKDGKPNFFKRIWIKIKETWSELKKVTWPSFKTVVKSTGVIIAVVLVFTVALFGIDTVLGLIFKAFTKSL